MEKFTTILTTYNSEETIDRALDSIFSLQGFNEDFKMEVIVVDDCSTDRTPEIISSYPVLYYSTKNNSGGPNIGRNIALNEASGDWICLMDHDDVWHKNRISVVLDHLNTAPIISSGYTSIDLLQKRKRDVVPVLKMKGSRVNQYKVNETFKAKLSRSKNMQNTYLGSLVFDSSLKHILFETEYGQVDYDWVLRLFHQNKSIEICQSLFDRYISGDNLSLNEIYRIHDHQYSIQVIKENYTQLYPKESHLGIKRIHGSLARYYYRMERMDKARKYFAKSGLNMKTILYYLTSFWGYQWVNRNFNVFG